MLRHAVRELAGLCLLPVPWRFDLAADFVLQQRVTFSEAATQWNKVVDLWGRQASSARYFPEPRESRAFNR